MLGTFLSLGWRLQVLMLLLRERTFGFASCKSPPPERCRGNVKCRSSWREINKTVNSAMFLNLTVAPFRVAPTRQRAILTWMRKKMMVRVRTSWKENATATATFLTRAVCVAVLAFPKGIATATAMFLTSVAFVVVPAFLKANATATATLWTSAACVAVPAFLKANVRRQRCGRVRRVWRFWHS